ncbi:MAG: hypothetical protein HJJLKODD_02717 [Phycisphaerae bacterium]|nr:hypothetical protein [Phycisphaerae bacterium]
MRPAPDDPILLTSHLRLLELTDILACGIARLRQSPTIGAESSQFSAKSLPTGLDVDEPSRPDGRVCQPERRIKHAH